MADINTVLGPISPDSLGVTLIHEHIVAGYSGWECDPLARPYDREKIVRVCQKFLEDAKACGVRTVVDATPVDLSRDVEVLKAVSEKLQMNIICITGRYVESAGRWTYLKNRGLDKLEDITEELYEGMMQEITKGVGNTGIKPGIIKAATGYKCILPIEEAVLTAAARASKETGVPILTHTEGGTMGPEQADMMIGAGADPAKIMIGHMCCNSSLQYQLEVLGKGVNIGFDRCGFERLMPDTVRLAMIVGLLKLGYSDKIMLSHDFVTCSFGRAVVRTDAPKSTAPTTRSLTHIFQNFIPALTKADVSAAQIAALTIENPRRFLGGL
jgi:phosphotriesterase-related protein